MNDEKEKSLELKKESRPSEEKVSEPNMSSVVGKLIYLIKRMKTHRSIKIYCMNTRTIQK